MFVGDYKIKYMLNNIIIFEIINISFDMHKNYCK